jgi:demethylspheroidene O-methyltransferase
MSRQKHTDRELNLKTRWVLRRNRFLGNDAFQRWAARTPLFRLIARRRAAHQFDLVAGFVYSQVLHVYVVSGLIGFMRNALRSSGEVATFAGLSAAATDRLLRAGRAIDLTESPQSGLWTLGQTGAELSANDGAMAMIRHHAILYRDLADPMALLTDADRRGSELSRYWSYVAGEVGPEASAGYSQLMAATQPMVFEQVFARYDFDRHQHLLDIGGGSGAFVESVARHAPRLGLGIFDLPDVITHCRERLEGSAILGRLSLHPGSFKADPIPTGYDVISLVRILHDHDDPDAAALIHAVFAALPPGGTLLIIEPMAETRGAEAMGDGYFGLYLWAMGSGRPRSYREYKFMLRNAGFSNVREVKTPLPIVTRMLVARK